MLLASESMAWDKSQGIPVSEPGSAQQETHFHNHGSRTSAFPLQECALMQTHIQTLGLCFGLGLGSPLAKAKGVTQIFLLNLI